jgi:hypothetical protein
MTYHGRPLELTVAMLRMAYATSIIYRRKAETGIVWSQELLNKLEPG